MKLIDSMPALSVELKDLLLAANELALADKIDGLSLVQRCSCHDDFCASFYTAPKPRGRYDGNHRCVSLEPDRGYIVLDVVDEEIMQVEVLYRDEVKANLARLFPET